MLNCIRVACRSTNIVKYSCSRCISQTVDSKEAEKFKNISSSWWENNSGFAVLHEFNRLRVPLIRDGLINTGQADPLYVNTDKPLTGVNILDVGCGGGILAEGLARIGAQVKGIDITEESINEAKLHSLKDEKIKNRLKYSCVSIDNIDEDQLYTYDAVVASEVIEHVSDVKLFLYSCTEQLKSGGSFFVTTINKTLMSNLLMIIAAEKILNIVPKGTHNWEKFIDPTDLQISLDSFGLSTRLVHGICYNPFTKTFSWSDNTSVNYALHAVKE